MLVGCILVMHKWNKGVWEDDVTRTKNSSCSCLAVM